MLEHVSVRDPVLMSQSPAVIARRLHAALEAGQHGEALRELFADDAVTVERPNLINPRGATSALEQMLAASVSGAGLLGLQRYDVHHVVEQGDLAIFRLTWTGVVAREVGPFAEGQVLTAHIAQFIRVSGGRIAEIETYDCYEPFA
jgi:ketosteroid isomerase-like protein